MFAEAFRKESKSDRRHTLVHAVLEIRVQVLSSPETGIELEETIMNEWSYRGGNDEGDPGQGGH